MISLATLPHEPPISSAGAETFATVLAFGLIAVLAIAIIARHALNKKTTDKTPRS